MLQENERYSSNTCPQLAPLTIPYSQLDGGGSNVSGVSWDNDYAPYRKIVRHMDSYVVYVEIGHLAGQLDPRFIAAEINTTAAGARSNSSISPQRLG